MYRHLPSLFSRIVEGGGGGGGAASILVSPVLKSPRKIAPVPAQRERITAFPYVVLCRHSHINLSLLFHILLMYWKAFHSRLPLTAGLNRSRSQGPQWRTIRLFCWIKGGNVDESPRWLIVVWLGYVLIPGYFSVGPLCGNCVRNKRSK